MTLFAISFNILLALVSIFGASITVYLFARLASKAWYRSKIEYIEKVRTYGL